MAPDTSTHAPPPPNPPPPPFGRDARRLRRSTEDRYLGGVAGGLAEHLGLEPNIIRIALGVAAIFSLGFVLVAYAAAWLFVPDTIDDEPVALRWYREHGPSSDRPVTTAILLVVAALVASGAWSVATDGSHEGPFPVFLVLGIAALAWATRHDRHRSAGPSGGDVGPGGDGPDGGGPGGGGRRPAPPTPAAPSTPTDPGADPTAVELWATPTAVVPGAEPSPDDLTEPVRRWSDDDAAPSTSVLDLPPSRRERRRQHRLVRNLFVLGAVEGATVTGALWATGWVSLPGWAVPATVLGIALVGLATAPLWGWSWALAGVAVLTIPFLVLAAIPGVTFRGGIGHHRDRPTSIADLPPSYRLGVGHQELDLTGLELAPGSRTVVRLDLGMGAAEVRLPRDVDVELRGHLGGGSVLLDDREVGIDGTDLELHRRFPATEGQEAARRPTVVLDADLGLGALQLERAAA
ncbi:PspC domain-containing protein [Aquihabitans sp. G128]|uniref:PspC domain-containing protein n=1 Tax=Aquihabitans sp. G128 TaxID=2849779 RepID=UPI001C227B45|nr:PspC domain-containing protein [Aquihabitans sp. G128]QXC61346.1 PspC domain-containing protein [Aquihabitans sp. G128]